MNSSRMLTKTKHRRYIYKTRGVCPPEIHFELQASVLRHLRFVGGGCHGNAKLVARLLEGRHAHDAIRLLNGIECRNESSCPSQLAEALQAALSGTLQPATSFRVEHDQQAHTKIGLIAELCGNHRVLENLTQTMIADGAARIYCLGDLTGEADGDRRVTMTLREHNIQAVLGPSDSRLVQGQAEGVQPIDLKIRDFLRQLPHLLCFRLGPRTGIAFHGEYLQRLPDYSDFEPFAIEINAVCGLSDCMRDHSVFPALAALTPQFKADIIVFSQTRQWGHWQVGGKDIISLGPAAGDGGLRWGLLEWVDGGLRFDPKMTTY
jgi:uncharacterized protein (TIGR03905 family)